MKLLSSKRRFLVAAAIVLLLLFLLRPGASRLKARIANSISLAVARPVEIGSVHLRLLPRPGFDLENLVVGEDPAFGAEPMLRAPEVTADLRLMSLVRGRLEIARLDLTEPSLNLVRRADGHWNLEALLERAQRTPLAPTAKSKREARPGFPYIEASGGRINFKSGQEKKPYALTNAEFALWQESDNAWGARLKAVPLRTDLNVSDTGVLRADGTWQRAEALRETPLEVTVEWDRAQLGQLTKLVSGGDRGWRGGVALVAKLEGKPSSLLVTVNAKVQDFRRYDISGGDPLQLAAQCTAQYVSSEGMLQGILCAAPVGEGAVTMRGDVGLPGVRKKALALEFERVPASALVELARHTKKELAPDLAATGIVRGRFVVRQEEGPAPIHQFEGHGEIVNFRVVSPNNKAEVACESIPFALTSTKSEAGRVKRKTLVAAGKAAIGVAAPEGPHLEFGPFQLAMGRPAAMIVRGWAAHSGYALMVSGEGEVAHVLRAARLAGLPALQAAVEGTAELNLQIAGSWLGSRSEAPLDVPPPQVSGTAQLRNVRAEVRGFSGGALISSAELQLSPDGVRVDKLAAKTGETQWTGWLTLPRGCGATPACPVHFSLNSDDAGLSELHEWLSPQPTQRLWYQVFASNTPGRPRFLENLHASGRVSVSRFHIRSLVATHVSATVDLNEGKLQISDLQADLLGGKHRGEWKADFTATRASYSGSGVFSGIDAEQLASLMQDDWISGTGGGTYQITASGADAQAFWDSGAATLQFSFHDGALPHILLAGDAGPLQVAGFQGSARLHDRIVELKDGKLISSRGPYEVSGTASLGRELNLKLTPTSRGKPANGSQSYLVSGTLAEPKVSLVTTPQTQAQLKP